MLRQISEPFIIQNDSISEAFIADIVGCGLSNNIAMAWWRSLQPNLAPIALMLQLYNPNGMRLGSPLTLQTEGKINDTITNVGSYWLTMASVKNNGFILAWRNRKAPASMYKQFFDETGKAKEPAFLISNTTPGAGNPARENFILVFDDLSSVVIWRGEEDLITNTYGQWFDPEGKKIGNEFLIGRHPFGINAAALGQQTFGIIFPTPFVVDMPQKLYFQLFNANGTQISEPFPIDASVEENKSQFDAEIIKANESKYLITWKQGSYPYNSLECWGQIFSSNEKLGAKFSLPCTLPRSTVFLNNQFYLAFLDTQNHPINRDKPGEIRGSWIASYDLTGKNTSNPYYIATNATSYILFTTLIPFANDSLMLTWTNGQVTYYGQTFSINSNYQANFSTTITANNQTTIQESKTLLIASNSSNRFTPYNGLHFIVGQIVLIQWLLYFYKKMLSGNETKHVAFAKNQQLWPNKPQTKRLQTERHCYSNSRL